LAELIGKERQKKMWLGMRGMAWILKEVGIDFRLPVQSDRVVHLQPGNKLILAVDGPIGLSTSRQLDISECDIIPLTDANLAAVRRGIERDVLPDERRAFFLLCPLRG
jgi:hypothetical protein